MSVWSAALAGPRVLRQHGQMSRRRWSRLVSAIRDSDDEAVEAVLVDLSRRNRLTAPFSLLVGAFAMLFQGMRLLFTNWRLTLIQILPAMLIWAAMLDFKVHVLKGRSFTVLRGPVLVPLIVAIAALTAAAYFLNGVFAFSVSGAGDARGFRGAVAQARRHRWVILGWGFAIGVALGFATTVSPRWGHGWFALILGIVTAVMMITYVTVPATIVGIRTERSRRDQITTTVVSGAMSAVVCSPPYLLGRFGIVLLGVRNLFVVGLLMLIIAVPLQTGAVTATKAVKFSTRLLAGPPRSASAASTSAEGASSTRTLPGPPRRGPDG